MVHRDLRYFGNKTCAILKSAWSMSWSNYTIDIFYRWTRWTRWIACCRNEKLRCEDSSQSSNKSSKHRTIRSRYKKRTRPDVLDHLYEHLLQEIIPKKVDMKKPDQHMKNKTNYLTNYLTNNKGICTDVSSIDLIQKDHWLIKARMTLDSRSAN